MALYDAVDVLVGKFDDRRQCPEPFTYSFSVGDMIGSGDHFLSQIISPKLIY